MYTVEFIETKWVPFVHFFSLLASVISDGVKCTTIGKMVHESIILIYNLIMKKQTLNFCFMHMTHLIRALTLLYCLKTPMYK